MIVDQERAEAFLASRFGQEIIVTPIGEGVWSKAFTFRLMGHEFVIRFGAHWDDFAKDRLAARYANPTLPVPRLVEMGEAFDGYFAISERLFGSYIDEVDGAQMRALLPSLFAALDAMRLADISVTTGYGGWGADGTAVYPSWREALLDVAHDRPRDRIHGWRERLEASQLGAAPFDEAYAHLLALAGHIPEDRHLIHSDLLHYNVLVEGDRITGVLDWGCGLYGDFLYDLAWLCFWQPWYPAWKGIDFQAEATRHYAAIDLEVPDFEERLRCCQTHIGLGSQAYQAHAGEWAHLEETARRTLDVAG